MEPKPKVSIPLWRLVANYYLSSIFCLPLIGYIIVSVIIGSVGLPLVASGILTFIASLITMWFGTGYGARYIQKRYVIENPAKVVKYATITMVVLQVFGLLLTGGLLMVSAGLVGSVLPAMIFPVYVVEDIVMTAVFYYASKKNLMGAPVAAPVTV